MKCRLCERSKGKRRCQVRDNAPICPVCCATQRNQACEGCRYYAQAQHHQMEKRQAIHPHHFVIEVNEEVEATVDHALELIEQQQYRQAESLLRPLQTTHPQNHHVQYGLGTLAAMQGEIEHAIQHFEQATQIFPYFLEAQYNKAAAYHKQLNIRKMVEAYREVVHIGDPQDPCVHHAQDVLTMLEQQTLHTDGISLDQYLQAMTYFERGMECFTAQNWTQAIHWFHQTLAITPRHPQSYGNIGLCYGLLGQKVQALEALDKALELDPQYEVAMVNRAIVERLQEGECLPQETGKIVEYYKEYPMQKKSYIEEFTQQINALQGSTPEEQ